MKRIGHVKKLIGSAAYLGLAMMLFPQTSFGQVEWAKDTGFVSREYRSRWFQEPENFGSYDLRKNPVYLRLPFPIGTTAAGADLVNMRNVMSRVTYDPFGNFLLPGGNVYNMKWNNSRLGSNSVYSSEAVPNLDPSIADTQFGYASSVFNNLMISSDEFSDWQTKLMIGSTIRTFFTSSTLMLKNFDGIRWDASNRKNSFTLLAQPGRPGGISQLTMLGAHWQSILGDKLKVGGTFINRQRGTKAYSHTDIDNGTAGMRDTPRYVYLVLTDCSPTNTSNGPAIYDLKTFIDGNDKTLQVPTRVFKIKDFLSTHRYYSGEFQKQYVFPLSTGQDFFPRRDQTYAAADWFLTALNLTNAMPNVFSKTADFNYFGILNLPDPSKPNDPQGRLFAADMSLGYQQATGTDVVIYEFMIPPEARDVKFKVLVANYYNIDLISAYYQQIQVGEASWNDQPFSPAYKSEWQVSYDRRNVARATMSVKDLSNMEWVTVAYDRWTGWNVYGIDAQFSWGGLKINGEINEYNALFSYPVNENLTGGGRNKETTRAWFVNLEKDFGKWGFGGEAYNYPLNYMKYNSLIEYPSFGNRGVDVDWDTLNDNYWGTAPYLTYHYDLSPTGAYVAFGDDFNNNGTIDQRESYTTPYAIGYNGNHFFLTLKPRDFLITLGRYNYKSITVSYDNLMTYLKSEKFGKYSNFMEYGWQNRIEKRLLRYNYNSYYEASHSWKNTSFFTTRLYTKKLNVFNDFLWTWSESFTPFGAQVLNIYAASIAQESSIFNLIVSPDQDLIAVGHSTNRGNKSPVSWSLTSVHKADYSLSVADARILPDIYIGGYRILKEKRIKELKFQSQIYFTHAFTPKTYSLKIDKYYTSRRYNAFPVIRVDYRVTPNTLFRFGLQGFPGIFPELTRVVNVKKYDDYSILNYTNRVRMLMAFENRTLYQGFNLLVMAGVRKDKQTWLESRGRLEPGSTEYFISVQSEGVR